MVVLLIGTVVVAFMFTVELVMAAVEFDGVVLVDVFDGARLVGMLVWVVLVFKEAKLVNALV